MKYVDFIKAIVFVNSSKYGDKVAAYRKDTNELLFRSVDGEDQIGPVPVSDPNYVFIPRKGDLHLGRDIVMQFVAEFIPNERGYVDFLFRKEGAFSRFKAYVDEKGLLEKWYEFSERQEEKMLRRWCSQNGVKLED